MTVQLSNNLIEIRTFGSIEEVRALDNFVESMPLSALNYRRLLGDYHLNQEVSCCVQKENGNLCGEMHKNGWVAERTDGIATIIGGTCAKGKFGADSSLIADSNRYINEKRRRERLATMLQLLPLKTSRIAQLAQLRSSLIDLQKRIKSATADLGHEVQRRLLDMVRTRRFDVTIDAIKYREGLDSKGRTVREKSSVVHVLGALSGLDLTAAGPYSTIYDAINDLVRSYERAEELDRETDITKKRSKEIESVVSRMQAYDRILQDGQRLIDLEPVFLDNDFRLLCFLSDDKTEKAKATKVAMHLLKIERHKDDPNKWLSKQEDAIKSQLQVEEISAR